MVIMYYPIKVTAYNTVTNFNEVWTFEGKARAFDFARSLDRTVYNGIRVDGWLF
jgi:hypothetical protein